MVPDRPAKQVTVLLAIRVSTRADLVEHQAGALKRAVAFYERKAIEMLTRDLVDGLRARF
jgi:hypothetical protein